jgi:hypothetical protein
MSLIQTVTQWFKKGIDVSDRTYTSAWYNSEILNGGQFFLKYTGAVNVAVELHISPADAQGHQGIDPADCYDVVVGVASANNSALGFFNPATPSSFDRPFKSFRVKMTTASNITTCYFCACANGVQ